MPGKHRKYLPHGLTREERRSPVIRRKIASCIRQVELKVCPKSAKKHGRFIYSECSYNPVKVCRSSILQKCVKKVKR